MTLEDLRETKRPEILRLAAQYGARNVRVFGSVATGESDEPSDVDFLVDLEPGRGLFHLGGFLMALEQLLGRPVDIVTEKGLRPRIREQVRASAVEL